MVEQRGNAGETGGDTLTPGPGDGPGAVERGRDLRATITDVGTIDNIDRIATTANVDALDHILDAWASEPSTRKRYDRLRLERKDGQALEVLIDADTARDLGDKLTIAAARALHRTRGPSPVEASTAKPGDLEDMARARKVLDLMGVPWHGEPITIGPLAEEFRASREDVEKAYTMVDEAQKITNDLRAELAIVKADRAKAIGELSRIDLTVDPSEPASP